jgi:hypothetical protein
MLARTAADSHGIAELADMTERARAIRSAFNEGTITGAAGDRTPDDSE